MLIPEDETLENFHSIDDLSVEIKYVFSINDIEKFGTSFPAHGYMTNPQIFLTPAESTQKRILKKMKEGAYTKVSTEEEKFPRETGTFLPKKEGEETKTRLPYPEPFGDITFTGDMDMYREQLDSTVNHFFHCLENVTVSHKVLGDWEFNKSNIRNYKIAHSGRDPELRKNNTFVARRNKKITAKFGAERLKEIAEGI